MIEHKVEPQICPKNQLLNLCKTEESSKMMI